jgi:hypothetical protein
MPDRLANVKVFFMAGMPNTQVLRSATGDYQHDPSVTHIGVEPPAVPTNGGPVTAPIALYRITATRVADGAAVEFSHARFIGQSAVTQVYRFSVE